MVKSPTRPRAMSIYMLLYVNLTKSYKFKALALEEYVRVCILFGLIKKKKKKKEERLLHPIFLDKEVN